MYEEIYEQEMVNVIDQDGDGDINFHEFVWLMTRQVAQYLVHVMCYLKTVKADLLHSFLLPQPKDKSEVNCSQNWKKLLDQIFFYLKNFDLKILFNHVAI